jgi:Kef-type K+ transport system membrane component KefB
LGAAVLDDALVLLGLSVFTALVHPSSEFGIGSFLWIILKMGFFIAIASAFGRWLLPKLNRRVNTLPISQGLIAFTFVIMLIFGWMAEMLGGMAAITGAFLAGLWFSRTNEKERIRSSMSTIAYSIFVPVFFINIGLSTNARALTGESGLLLLVMVLVAVLGKSWFWFWSFL